MWPLKIREVLRENLSPFWYNVVDWKRSEDSNRQHLMGVKAPHQLCRGNSEVGTDDFRKN